MIRIDLILICDRCRFPLSIVTHRDTLMRSQIEAVRDMGRRKGWERFRPTNVAPNGDYCPECAEAIRSGKPRAPKARPR